MQNNIDNSKKELVDYINNQLQSGVSESSIITAIKTKGWTEKDYFDALTLSKDKYTQDTHRDVESIWFWWIALTIIYVGLFFINEYASSPVFLGYVLYFVGLFVPYGLLSVLGLGELNLFSLLFFIPMMVIAGIIMRRTKLNSFSKITLNIILLFFMTMIVDFIRSGIYTSMLLFWAGGKL